MEQIRYLNAEERQNTRNMYETIFPEDSKAFIDYYYRWKTRENEIVVMEDEKGFQVMIHLNPYYLQINTETAAVSYIVAVATRTDCRRRGKMQQVMEWALKDMQKQHQPFTFLLPADPAYYSGQGFVFFPKQTKEVTEESNVCQWNVRPMKKSELQEIAEAANDILAEQYAIYVKRDVFYYERLQAETAVEHGGVLIIEAEAQIVGTLVYGKDEKVEIKELLLKKQQEGYRKEICNLVFGEKNWNEDDMRMMVRITDLRSFDGMLRGEHKVWKVRVEDPVIEANNGSFQIEWTPQGGSVVPLDKTAEQCMSIQELTAKIMADMSVFIREWV